jgi:hypothetical protein
MTEPDRSFTRLRRDHPVFFWGTLGVILVLLSASAAVAARVPEYRRDARVLDRQMSERERATRDRVLESRSRRTALAIALLRRELRLKAMQQKGLHLAVNTEESTLALRHGAATLREVHLEVGRDSIVHAPDGRTWRFVRAVGERRLAEKEAGSDEPIPEWVYISRGVPVPPEAERRVEGGNGKYILHLDDGTEIYSRPEAGPLAEGVKPGDFVASEDDLRAIFDAVSVDTPVYIY